MFDDNGIILGDVVWWRDEWWMFYVGFQLVQKAKFLAFSGLARSADGESFSRVSSTPVLDRSDEGRFIRAIHCVQPTDEGWRVWYAAGSGWETVWGGRTPGTRSVAPGDRRSSSHACDRRTLSRAPGAQKIPGSAGRECVGQAIPGELYTRGTKDGEYIAGSGSVFKRPVTAGVRYDDALGLRVSAQGWDSRAQLPGTHRAPAARPMPSTTVMRWGAMDSASRSWSQRMRC